MKKLKFLILYGLKKRLLKKSFLISNIIIGLLTILIINLPTIIGLFENDDDAFVRIAYVVDEATLGYISQLDETLNQGLEEDIFIFYETQESMKDTFFEQNEYDILLMIQSDNGRLSLDLYRFETTYDTVITQTIQFLDVFSQNQAYVPPVIDSFLPDDYEDPFINEIISGISSVFTLPLFLIMTFGIQFVGVDIIEEKSSKAIETIISSVKANIHFLSKIIASLIFITIQSLLLIIYGSIGTLIGNQTSSVTGVSTASLTEVFVEFFPNWQGILIVTASFIFVGALLYLVIAALTAAISTTQEDYQTFQGPIMIMLVIGFYISIFASAAGGDTLLRIASFIPFFAPMTAPVAFAAGLLTPLEVILALLILIITTIGVIVLVTPIYKVAILSYEQTKLFKRLKTYFIKSKHE
jgi:ABC-2 type transport system permease protein